VEDSGLHSYIKPLAIGGVTVGVTALALATGGLLAATTVAVLGRIFGETLGESTKELTKAGAERFVETFFDKASEPTIDGFKSPHPNLEDIYREALRLSLFSLRPADATHVGAAASIRLNLNQNSAATEPAYRQWFEDWDTALKKGVQLDLAGIELHHADVFAPVSAADLSSFQATMARIAAQGAMINARTNRSIVLKVEDVPEPLMAQLTSRLPQIFPDFYRKLLVKPENATAMNESELLFRDQFLTGLRLIADHLASMDQKLGMLVPAPLSGAAIWAEAERQYRRKAQGTRQSFPESSERFYERRAIEDDLDRFLQGHWSAIVVVGQSGMGKSTMVAHLSAQYASGGNVCAFFQGSQLTSVDQLDNDIILRLLDDDTVSPAQFWTCISAEAVRRSKYVILFVDAVNEFNDAGGEYRPAHLMHKLNRLVLRAFKQYPRIKIVITCRPETWNRGLERFREEFDDEVSAEAYYGGVAGVTLSLFGEDEFQRAYDRYRIARSIRTPYEGLSELARYHLRDPFLLRIATEAYEGQEIPRDLDTGKIFDLFANEKKLRGLTEAINDIVAEMFDGGEPGEVQRVAILRDADLQAHNRALFDALNTENPGSCGYRLKEANVLRETTIITGRLVARSVCQLRFTYDRFAQYLLSNELIAHVEALVDSGATLSEAGVTVIRKNLPASQRMNIVFGALQRTLLLLCKGCTPAQYAGVLQSIALIDARGLNLAISVLARVGRSDHGLEILSKLLKCFEGGTGAPAFPLIDAVYRILQDSEYRAWLAEYEAERVRHLKLLYGYFQWGLSHADDRVSAVAVQYMFFLWEGKDSLTDAVAATDLMLARISGLAFSVAIPERRRLLSNLVALLILLLAELSDPQRADLALDAAKRGLSALQLSRSALRALGVLNQLMAPYLVNILKKLKNPINFVELNEHFSNPAVDLPRYEFISAFLVEDCDPHLLEPELPDLIRSRNGFVIQMLTFTLSVAWERSKTPEDSELSLQLIRRLFEVGEPVAEYCASLALYHINFFGTRATPQTMEMMGTMAAHILAIRKGEFQLETRPYNFNIIGTYGRSLYKNRAIVSHDAEIHARAAALQYAIDALKLASDNADEGFYLYICENIGLLGVLITPEPVLTVITEILCDVRLVTRSEPKKSSFSAQFLDTARKTVLQSLANIRVLYRSEVDRYLFDALEAPELYDEVANQRTPAFSLETFHSWAFEQLMFRAMTKYREEIGIDMILALLTGAQQKTTKDCIYEVIAQLLSRLRGLTA
jgi:hypothetical protein